MGRRASFANNMNEAAAFLEKNYITFKQHFDLFFPELQKAVNEKLKELEA
jgi:acyl carrier protein phosphodiesterase